MVHGAYYVQELTYQEIKLMASRPLILREMMRGGEAVSPSDLEHYLPTIGRSTISRTLLLLLLHHLIRVIDDGPGALKYAVYDDNCGCSIDEEHTHFYHENCHRTLCLKHIVVPVVPLPEGFTVRSVSYVLKSSYLECTEKLK